MIDRPFSELVQSLAARTPAPGGGAAGGLAAAMGNALLLMVVRFSRGKKANVAREPELAAVEQALLALHARILLLAERDAASFAPVAAAYQLPQGTASEKAARHAAIQAGLRGAMVVPQETVGLARDALAAVMPVAGCAGKSIASDFAAGAELLRSAAEIAFLNVRVNVALLDDPSRAAPAVAAASAQIAEVRRNHALLRAAADPESKQ